MKLSRLTAHIPSIEVTGDSSVEVTGLTHDSRRVRPGDVFAAVRGLTVDGRRFIPQALEAGAAAIMVEAPLEENPGVPVVHAPDILRTMSWAAAEIHGRPSEDMTTIGVTGTNGKTTTCHLIESILTQAGLSTGVLGTVAVRFGGETFPADMTTPEGPDLQDALDRMRRAHCQVVVMEASSHALELGRVEGTVFDLGVFTNLSQDHLDFHGDLERYFGSKKKLFERYLTGRNLPGGPRAAVNVDDGYGRRLTAEIDRPTTTYSLTGPAEVRAEEYDFSRAGIRAVLRTPAGRWDLSSPLVGEFNVYNLLAAVAAGVALDQPPETIVAGLGRSTGAPGRLERVGSNDEFLVLVDYAHTPGALDSVLSAVRRLDHRRLITVFGCGGDRDRTKRPLMARAAGQWSDLTILTSDNPRTEDPLAIIDQAAEGFAGLDRRKKSADQLNGTVPDKAWTVEPDRRAAIGLGCRLMEPGDVLVIAGKGHEDYQVLGRTKVHFDDREEAAAALLKEGKF